MPKVPTVRPNGPAIRDLRKKQELSTAELARKCGPYRHAQSIRNLEVRDQPAGEKFVAQVAKALGVSIEKITVRESEAGNEQSPERPIAA